MNSPYDSPRTTVDPALLAEYTAGVMFSRIAYENEHRTPTEGIDYAERARKAEASTRYRNRKKGLAA